VKEWLPRIQTVSAAFHNDLRVRSIRGSGKQGDGGFIYHARLLEADAGMYDWPDPIFLLSG